MVDDDDESFRLRPFLPLPLLDVTLLVAGNDSTVVELTVGDLAAAVAVDVAIWLDLMAC